MLTGRVVRGLACLLILASLPVFAIRRPDTGTSKDGLFSNCPATPGGGTCPYLGNEGTATLSGTDASGNAITVTITLYNWGSYPCTQNSCQTTPVINSAVLDVTLTGSDSVGIESLAVKGLLSNPSYVSCGGTGGTVGLACIVSPEPDDNSDVQEPTPIANADHTNTRWDFGGLPASSPPAPAVPFDQLVCESDGSGKDSICTGSSLGEAVLVVSNSVAQNHLGTAASNYLVTLTDGTKLGTLAVPASPTKHAANNTQATETVITEPTYRDYTDTSQTYPQIDQYGNPVYPNGFALAPVPPPSSSSFPSCYPTNEMTGLPDTRTFRTVWYSYTAPTDGSITITTAGSRYDTIIYVFTGSASSPTTISCDDDPPSGGLLQAVTTFNATEATNYQIVVYETPTPQTAGGTGYPLSVDGTLYFNFSFSTQPPTTTTTLTLSPDPSIFGHSVEFVASVTSKRPGTPTGTVTFKDGSTTLGVAPLSGGRASASAVPLTIGTNVITASYSGDSNFDASSASKDQTVNKADSTSTVKSSQNPSNLGQSVTFTAVIAPQFGGETTGTVTFKDGSKTLAVVTVSGNKAALTTSTLTAGTHSITAVYSGDTNFIGSTSKTLSQVVK
jgi:hypothetical protein